MPLIILKSTIFARNTNSLYFYLNCRSDNPPIKLSSILNRAFSTNNDETNSNNKGLSRWKTLFSNKEKAATYSIEVKPKEIEPEKEYITHISNHFRLPDVEIEHPVFKHNTRLVRQDCHNFDENDYNLVEEIETPIDQIFFNPENFATEKIVKVDQENTVHSKIFCIF